jgi:hypothetical protein
MHDLERRPRDEHNAGAHAHIEHTNSTIHYAGTMHTAPYALY